ncbi:putative quinol monooxygenase [Brevundimonas subvibrioides]|uniref:Antibiotic biosynthesis monooxygenase n=1 Tax=Brevundimonas subvibrioides (strain ATCC 15264 / DSM 4735 / LMG 14903 / NBRC 16000 / CB 81) TaxID=633149 RepID=D9QGQ7_BRESC|nr:antibiotic biosynthesis monooxygenase [Brevundimonas subvibrioides]ADL00873.1 Antibiotic biosynthesis monooxygenase [Brevundimonas subvibrioides ATCC 15264]
MIHEIAEIDIIPGHEAEFEAAVAEAASRFRSARGCRSLALNRSVEHPRKYRLVVGWDTIEDHMVHFRESEAFQVWRGLVGPHFASPPQVEHVETVLEAFSQ